MGILDKNFLGWDGHGIGMEYGALAHRGSIWFSSTEGLFRILEIFTSWRGYQCHC